MTHLQRHQLVWLHRAAWQRVLSPAEADEQWDDEAAACLQHWATHDLPLVVARQPHPSALAGWMLGLSAPLQWGRRRLFVLVQHDDIQRTGHFPEAATLSPLLPADARAGWLSLCAALAQCGVCTRVFGSYGWQAVSGLVHVRDTSDLDLLLQVNDQRQADAAVAVLASASFSAPRLDGELIFPDGAAVAWREWQQWRARGSQGLLLVKRLHGAALEGADFSTTAAEGAAA